jgi:dihydroorotate dehydrogenase electron transfer subunit
MTADLVKTDRAIKLFQEKVPILYNLDAGPGYFKMGLDSAELAQNSRPGQFVMVKPKEGPIPLLRRPFSFHDLIIEGGEVRGFDLLYKVVGEGTQIMSEMKPGALLDVLGPLGKGFSWPEKGHKAFLVAGGVGVAPLYYLARLLRNERDVVPTVFLGGCSCADILCREEFRALGAEVCITTEDCTLGERGVITALVESALKTGRRPDIMYGCGPQSMLRVLAEMAAAHEVACEISLERVMACGFGACLGCAVEKAGDPKAYFHACTDGPVFDSRAVLI